MTIDWYDRIFVPFFTEVEIRKQNKPFSAFLIVNLPTANLQSHDPLKNTPTLRETNVAPENWPSQKETSIPTIHFQVPC